MDKFHILREFTRSAIATVLDFDAVRLYLLLLATADETGRGVIDPAALKKALERTSINLEASLRVLTDVHLVEIPLSPLPDAHRPLLGYRLLPLVGGETW